MNVCAPTLVLPAPPRKNAAWFAFMLVPVRPADALAARPNEGQRALLRLSQWPQHDVRVFNTYGPSSDPTRHKRRRVAATTLAPPPPTTLTRTGRTIQRKSRRQRRSGVHWQLAMIVHCGASERAATDFLNQWNHRSRGPVPRAAWGFVLSMHSGLESYYDFDVLFDCAAPPTLLGAPLTRISFERDALVMRPSGERLEPVRRAVECVYAALRGAARATVADDAEGSTASELAAAAGVEDDTDLGPAPTALARADDDVADPVQRAARLQRPGARELGVCVC